MASRPQSIRLSEQKATPFTVARTTVNATYSMLLALTGLVCGTVTGTRGCSVQNCYEPLREDISLVVDDQLVFPVYTDEKLYRICQVHEETRYCVASSLKECKPTERFSIEGFDLAIGYLCHEGFQAYKLNRDCFGLKPVIHIAEVCNATYNKQLSDLQRDSTKPIPQKKSLLCSHVDELTACVRDGITKECGQEAGKLIFNLKAEIHRPVKESIGCDALTVVDATSQLPVVFLVIVGALIFMALILTAAALHRRVRSHHDTLGSSFAHCCTCDRLVNVSRHLFHRSGQMPLKESTVMSTKASGQMKISNIDFESTQTLQGSVYTSTTLAKSSPKSVNLDVSKTSTKYDKRDSV